MVKDTHVDEARAGGKGMRKRRSIDKGRRKGDEEGEEH